jgi:MFS family permease
VLLYPVYTLLFSDAGLAVWQISSLFVIWSVSSMLFEVPSGALADATSRRRLLVVGPLLTSVAFGLWVAYPSFWVFALGFMLWGLKSALTSGALEALVYEELQRIQATEKYSTLMGRGQTAGVLAAMLSGLAAAPVFAKFGFDGVGAVSVILSLLAALVATLLPENRIRPAVADHQPGWTTSLSSGLHEARRSPRIMAAVVLVAVVASVWGALDEYTPPLIGSTGVGTVDVSLLMVVIWAGAAAGGLLAGRAARLGARSLAGLLCCAAALMATGALSHHPAGVVPLAAAFGIFQLTTVVADARLQDSISGPARATVTSVAGMSTDVVTLVVYGSYAALTEIGGHPTAFTALMLPYLVIAAILTTIQFKHLTGRGHDQ